MPESTLLFFSSERRSIFSSMYALGSFVVLAMMYQAEYRHKLSLRKKARVYQKESNKMFNSAVNDGSDLSAFQKRFSNMAGSQAPAARPAAPPSRRIRNDQTEVKENRLESLLREFDDNDQ